MLLLDGVGSLAIFCQMMPKNRHASRPRPNHRPRDEPLIRSFAVDHSAVWTIPWHDHAWHQLAYASSGVLGVRTEDGLWIVPPCRGVWIPAGLRHSIEIAGPVAVRTLYVDPVASRALPRACSVVNVSPLLRELILHTVQLGTLSRQMPEHRRLIAFLLDQLLCLPSVALQLPMPTDPHARRTAECLYQHPDDAGLLDRLLRELGVSRRTLERRFRAETNMTLGKWRQLARHIQAVRLLASGRAVTDVALDVGYESVSAFIGAFKRCFGTTPARYFDSLPIDHAE